MRVAAWIGLAFAFIMIVWVLLDYLRERRQKEER